MSHLAHRDHGSEGFETSVSLAAFALQLCDVFAAIDAEAKAEKAPKPPVHPTTFKRETDAEFLKAS